MLLASRQTPTEIIDDILARVRMQTPEPRGPEALRRSYIDLLGELLADTERCPDSYAAYADGVDVLGRAYESLLSGVERRTAGQFQTPFWAADVMAGWLLSEPTRLLADPGVGAGRLLFRALGSGGGTPRLLGLDADPLAIAMAEVNLRLRGSTRHRLLVGDFLLDELDERPDAITCNPPYSRHHAIPAAYKWAIHAGFERRLGLRFSRLAALHALFLVRAIEVAADGARIAFITPSDWLDVGYGKEIKRYVAERCHVEALILVDEAQLLFDGVFTTAAITLLRRDATGESTRVVRVGRQLPDPATVVAAARGESTSLNVERLQLCAEKKWSRPTPRVAAGVRLDLLARIRRGIATGANRFFVLSEAKRREHGLPLSTLRLAATSPKLLKGDQLTMADLEALPEDRPRWAIDCRDPEAEQQDTPLGRYLRLGRELGIHKGYLTSHRKPWYTLERRGASPILFSYFNRQRPRFIRNLAGAIPLNTFLIVEPIGGVDPDLLCALLGSPAVARQMNAARRTYGGGLWKLEPSELGGLRVRWPADS